VLNGNSWGWSGMVRKSKNQSLKYETGVHQQPSLLGRASPGSV
jgi:hypothetical protein